MARPSQPVCLEEVPQLRPARRGNIQAKFRRSEFRLLTLGGANRTFSAPPHNARGATQL